MVREAEGKKEAAQLDADAQLYIAQKQAEARRTIADADAYAVRAVAEAISDGSDGAVNFEVKKLQADALRALGERARELLRDWGIILVTLDHLPGTYLDGAAMCRGDGVDIIAMTLRHDRIDNFWFTLIHEFCHISEHLAEDTPLILTISI